MPRAKPKPGRFAARRLPRGCQLYVPLLEGSGALIRDHGPLNLTGTLYGGRAPSPWGPSVLLAGNADRIVFNGGGAFPVDPVRGISASAAVLLRNDQTTAMSRYLISKRKTGGIVWSLRLTTDAVPKLAFYVGSSGSVSTLALPNDGCWYAVGVSVSSTLLTFYRLGVGGLATSVVSHPYTWTDSPTTNLAIGNSDEGAGGFVGAIAAGVASNATLGGVEMIGLLNDLWTGFAGTPRPSAWAAAAVAAATRRRPRRVGVEECLVGVAG